MDYIEYKEKVFSERPEVRKEYEAPEYIEREAAKAAIMRVSANLSGLLVVMDDIPPADVEPVKHGRWLPQIVLGQKAWDCSECKTLGSPHWKRCPVCEAKMDGE